MDVRNIKYWETEHFIKKAPQFEASPSVISMIKQRQDGLMM